MKSGLLWNCFLPRWCSIMSRSKHALMFTHSFASDIASVFPDVTWTQFRSSSTYRSCLHYIRGRHSDVKTCTLMALHNIKGIDGVSLGAFIWLHLTFSLTQQLWSLRLGKFWFPATLTWTLTCDKQQQCYVKSTIFIPVLCGTAVSYIYRLGIEWLLHDENK